MMDCQDKLAVCVNGQEIISIEPLLEEQGSPVGGTVICRDITGTIGIALQSASPQFDGPRVLIRHGGVNIVNPPGKRRVAIVDGDDLTGEDGGIITLTASTDSESPTSPDSAPPSALVLNASGRSLEISAADGTKVLRLTAAGSTPIEVRDAAGRQVFLFDSAHAALYIGAKGNEGDLIVNDGEGTKRIHLNAQKGEVLLYSP